MSQKKKLVVALVFVIVAGGLYLTTTGNVSFFESDASSMPTLVLENLTKPGNLTSISNNDARLMFTLTAPARLRSFVICPVYKPGYCFASQATSPTQLTTNAKGVAQVIFTVEELRSLTRYTQGTDKKYEFRVSVLSQDSSKYLGSNTVSFTVVR